MTQPPAVTTVWIVDEDLGFVWWLGDLFTEAGCRALPALSCEQAISLMKNLNLGIDLLVVNPQLPDVMTMLQFLGRMHRNFKLVVIGKPFKFVARIRPHANLERPSSSDLISRPEWLKKVRKLLTDVAAAAAV